jgi:hypothetical protein
VKWENALPGKPTNTELLEGDNIPDARPVLRARTDLREPFLAYQDKTHFFFLTISGKLYACRKRGERQHTELLWADVRRPICAVIHDTASQKTFAFTKAAGGKEKADPAVYFELTAKLTHIAYDRNKIPEMKQSDPLATMTEYARILLRQKKVKVE